MERIIIGGILAFLLTYFAIPVIITVANEKKLYDVPDDKRKLHLKPIPSLGGFGMFIGFILALLLTINFTAAPQFQYYIASFMIIFFIGIKDDILALSVGKKFLGQIAVACILIFQGNLLIADMQGFLGIHAIDSIASYFLTLFAIVVIINSFNLIDGVDGLAGSVGIITSTVFATFFFINGNIPYAVLGFGFAGSLLGFLIYNFHPAKIFMGDTGSLLIGLVNSILVIKFIETGSTVTNYPITAAPAVGFAIILLPLMDTLRVFAFRIANKRSPFSPDRNHIHHLLLDRGFNARSVVYACGLATSVAIAAAFYMQTVMGCTWIILTLMISFFAWVYVLYLKKSRYKLRVIKGEMDKVEPVQTKRVKLVSFFNEKVAAVKED
ncbi:MAG: undecaprenyl-phosphate N-acetylglucosaminyl 1-phosphate transferase [Segetibacter sp.]|nr:undecaprenyl-phosphate N-acetylglucosaminyl 1-phosphate transferase [Segetibacter sp.]